MSSTYDNPDSHNQSVTHSSNTKATTIAPIIDRAINKGAKGVRTAKIAHCRAVRSFSTAVTTRIMSHKR